MINESEIFAYFNEALMPYFEQFELKNKFYKNGDFGDLNQIEFNSDCMGGVVDFWSNGYISLHLVDYLSGNELLNIMLESNKIEEQKNQINILKKLIHENQKIIPPKIK